jgi:hypothetical protein
MSVDCRWRDDIDSLAFTPPAHRGQCVVHRRAFRALLQFAPQPDDCRAFFAQHSDRFVAAAQRKIERAALPADANFHLNSRDIRRAERRSSPRETA